MNFGNLFNMDNPIWRVLGMIWDAIWLTILWAIGSILIVTIGPSTSALFSVALKLSKNQEGSVTRQFFEAYKRDFLQAFVAGIIVLFVGGVVGYNLYAMYTIGGNTGNVLTISMLIFAYVFLMIAHFIFAIIAKFSNSLSNLFAMAFLLSVKNFGWTLLIITVTVCVVAVAVFLFWPLLMIAAGGIAIIDSFILNRIFDQYIEENDIH